MIFKPVTEWTDKSEKAFFLELISIYIRLTQVFCETNGYVLEKCSADIETELKELGVISSKEDISMLKKELSKNHDQFIDSVSFVVTHKKQVGSLLDNLYNSKRKEIQEKVEKEDHFKVVDFFCGAGGLSLGFIQEGFKVVLANDIEDVCINTYRYNHPELSSDNIIKGDIRNIVDNIEEHITADVDVVIGGPPCQGFSEANRQRVIDDPRNKLYKYFVKAVEKIAPKIVVMENVKGMLKVADQVVEDFENLRVKNDLFYKAGYCILNSQDFSVAQSRERLIYIAVRSDIIQDKSITPEQIFKTIKQNCTGNTVYTLMDALKDIKPLEAPRKKNMNEIDSDVSGKKIDVNNYRHNSNPYLALINMGRDIPFVFNHKARYCSDVNYEIYKRLDQGDDATNEKIKDIMPYAHRNHCFKDKYYKLIADRPCRTITAHLRMDCHSHIHPYQIRSLTPREAARVQSFPDDYLFLGPYLKTYMQIGNAVPTLMARGIAKVIKEYL